MCSLFWMMKEKKKVLRQRLKFDRVILIIVTLSSMHIPIMCVLIGHKGQLLMLDIQHCCSCLFVICC